MKIKLSGLTNMILFVVVFLTTCIHVALSNPLKVSSNEVKINDDSGTASQKRPVVAMNRFGVAVVAWVDHRNDSNEIYAQKFSDKGLAVGANFMVAEVLPLVSGNSIDVAINDLGHFVVVWRDRRNGKNNIYARRFAANGEPLGTDFAVSEESVSATRDMPVIAMNCRGDFVVCWLDDRNGPIDIYAQRFDAAGNRLGTNFKVNDSSTNIRNDLDVDMAENGDFVVAWVDLRRIVPDIYTQRYDHRGVKQGANEAVTNYGTGLPGEYGTSSAAVAFGENGEYIVCWKHVTDIYGAIFHGDGSEKKPAFRLSDYLGVKLRPRVAGSPNGTYSVIWSLHADGGYHVLGRMFNSNGTPLGPGSLITNAESNQFDPELAMDDLGKVLIVWADDRNGDDDIFGTALGPRNPLNLTAGSGFDGFVPLMWDHVYGIPNIDQYNIYRSTLPGGPFAKVASVNLSERGSLGRTMRDWIDMDVVNGTTYYYSVSAVVSGVETSRSATISATPNSQSHSLRSKWTALPPTIDGEIADNEWDNGTVLDISHPAAPHSITLYIKNDAGHLYIAVDDSNDVLADANNRFGLLFDKDYDRSWDANTGSDGAIILSVVNAIFTGYNGSYPSDFHLDAAVAASGVDYAISTSSGHLQYEIAIDLTTSPLQIEAGSTIGAAIWISDPSNYYPGYYGNAATWPPGSLWDAPLPLGTLTLAAAIPNKLTASDGEQNDSFGRAIAVDGDYAVVGAPFNDNEKGSNAGAVYVFIRDGENWTQQAKLIADDGNVNDFFGSAVAISGEHLAVGAPGDDDAGNQSGSVYIFKRDGRTWSQQAKITADADADDKFGFSLAMDGDYLIVGAVSDEPFGEQSGSAYVFKRSLSTWTQQQKLTASDGAANDNFGISVAIDGNYVAIGAINDDNEHGVDAGAVYIFKQEGEIWSEQTKILAEDGAAGDMFHKVAICDDWLAVGAEGDDFNGENAGSVYLFQHNGDVWSAAGKVLASDGAPNDNFGTQLDLNSTRLVVSAPNDDDNAENAGAIYLYDFDGASWSETGKISPPYGDPDDFFGAAVAMSQDYIIVGANRDDDRAVDAGAVYFFRQDQATSVETGPVTTAVNFILHQNYPNPFNPSTSIRYELPKATHVRLHIYNTQGQLVRTLVDDYQPAGIRSIVWDGLDDQGRKVTSGIYFYRIQAGDFAATQKMLLVQ